VSDSGKEFLAALNQVRNLFEEMSRLLSTADASMQEAGWKPLKGSQVTAEMSWAIYAPRQWMPSYLCRFYENATKPHLLPCVSLLLGVYEASEQGLLTEPLIAASLCDYGKGNKVAGWQYHYCNWHLWSPNRKDDGTVCTVDPMKVWPEEKCQATLISSFALPLMTITDAASLKERITLPLCKLAS
jgi:hypothetical protein